MRSRRPWRTRGFSLVELVIVIVIVAILAAIAIPRVSRGARGAGDSALRADLAALRHAIEQYAAEHNGYFPAAQPAGTGPGGPFGEAGSEDAFRNQLLLYTDVEGACSKTKDATHCFGPYLRHDIPALPVGNNQNNHLTVSNTTPEVVEDDGTGTGWVYDYATGEIIANSADTDASGTTTYDQY